MKTCRLPVLIVGYSRVATLVDLVETAIQNDVKSIYVALDGSLNKETEKQQSEIIESLNEIKRNSIIPIHIKHRKRNLGSGAGVINALNWFFSEEEAGIVLEDDLVLSADFFSYMNHIVPMIESEPDLLLASGTRLRENISENATICSYPVVWGWGTSRQKWSVISNILFDAEAKFPHEVGLSEKWFWRTGKRRALKSQIDAWDIPLATGMRANGYFSVVPPVNLVSNIGFDAAASHTTTPKWPLQLKLGAWLTAPIFISRSEIELNTNDVLMRRMIFQISSRNILTGILSIVLDPIRFFNRRKMLRLKDRVNLEAGTNL